MERLIAKLICIKNKETNVITMNHYIYLLREREFIKTNEQIFKIGKTTQEGLGRFKNYPNGSELILHIKCTDCHTTEKQLIAVFKSKYKHRSDIGTEYFEGDYFEMMRIIMDSVMNTKSAIQPNPKTAEEDLLWSKFQKKKTKNGSFDRFCVKRRDTVQFDIDYDKLSPLDMLKKYTCITDLFITEKESNRGYLRFKGGPEWYMFGNDTEEALGDFIEANITSMEDVRNYSKRLQMIKNKISQIKVDKSRKIIDSYVIYFDFHSKKFPKLENGMSMWPDRICEHALKYRETKSDQKITRDKSDVECPEDVEALIIDFRENKIRALRGDDMYWHKRGRKPIILDFTHLSQYECTHEGNDLINPTAKFRDDIHEFINLFISDVNMFKNIMYDIFDGKKGIYRIKRRGNTKNYGMDMLIHNLVSSMNIRYVENFYRSNGKRVINSLYLNTISGNKIPKECVVLYDNIGCKDIHKYSEKYLIIVNDNKGEGIDCNYDAVKELAIVKNQEYHNFPWDDTLIGNGIMAGILWWLVDNYDR